CVCETVCIEKTAKARITVSGAPLFVRGTLLTPEWEPSRNVATESARYPDVLHERKTGGWDLSSYGLDDNLYRWAKLLGSWDKVRQAGMAESAAYGDGTFFCLSCRTFEKSRRRNGERMRGVRTEYRLKLGMRG